MNKFFIIGILFVLLAGCQLNPAIRDNLNSLKTENNNQPLKKENPVLVKKPSVEVDQNSQKVPVLVTGRPDVLNPSHTADVNSKNYIDKTGLVGKKLPAKMTKDGKEMQMGNNYFICYLGDKEGPPSDVQVAQLRSGRKPDCVNSRKIIIALTKTNTLRKTYEFLDAVEIDVPKNNLVEANECQGAIAAMFKSPAPADDIQYFINPIKSWGIVNGKIALVSNKSVKCTNSAYGI